jgi:methyltransferase
MVVSRRIYFGLLAVLVTERLFELWLSRRNKRWALSRGGIEVGTRQYRVMVTFHTLFIIACAAEVTFRGPCFPPFLSVMACIGEAGAQAIRYWSVATLGERWNTRIIVIPNTPPVILGPYRYIRHPNYAAVVIEIACIPLIQGLLITAAVFSTANAILLAFRITLEERALGNLYQTAFCERPRFIPRILG